MIGQQWVVYFRRMIPVTPYGIIVKHKNLLLLDHAMSLGCQVHPACRSLMSSAWPGVDALSKSNKVVSLTQVLTLVHDAIQPVFKDSWVAIGVGLAALPLPATELPGDLSKYLDSAAAVKSFTKLRSSYTVQLIIDLCTAGSLLDGPDHARLAEFLSSLRPRRPTPFSSSTSGSTGTIGLKDGCCACPKSLLA